MTIYVIGVDVGGTNTDAVCLDGNTVIDYSKVSTTADVTSGVKTALENLLSKLEKKGKIGTIGRVNIGTTHFVNAVIQRQNLTPVAVVRLCGTATNSLKPFVDFPDDLKQRICTSIHLINGGYQFDGQVITQVDKEEVLRCIEDLKKNQVKNVVISGVFSPVNGSQEEQVAALFRENYNDVSLTLSHHVGQMGLLERENASILNECLKPLCATTISAFTNALKELNLKCPLFLTQNDGTVISAEQTLDFPIYTFSSGPTNSMRGAAHLSDIKDAIVIDIGGTTSDAGCLMAGFPKEASARVKVGGATTNFRMPDVVSIGLGGGSKVKYQESDKGIHISIGPESVGFRLGTHAKVFGGDILTTSCIAVATNMATIGDPKHVEDLPKTVLNAARDEIHKMVEDLIDLVKLSEEDVVVILVGGGSILVDEKRKLKGASKVIKPPHFQVANAVGAALSQVGGMRDTVVALANTSRDDALKEAKEQAKQNAIEHGATPDTVEITEVSEVPLAYLPGNATRIKIKAVGNLKIDVKQTEAVKTQAPRLLPKEKELVSEVEKLPVSDSSQLKEASSQPIQPLQETEPEVDPNTGEWSLSYWDVECISIGAGILGCGGGGSPYLGKLMALQQLKEGNKIKIILPERLNTTPELTGVVATVAFMGAPGVIVEKIPSGKETSYAMQCMQDLFAAGFKEGSYEGQLGGVDIEKKDGGYFIDNFPIQSEVDPKMGKEAPKIVAVMSAEIGGLNAMEPLVVAARTGLPVVDCDGMGRAFPELQMFVPAISGNPLYPSTLADDTGIQRCVALQTDTPKDLENFFRVNVVKMGCAAALTFSPLKKEQLLQHSVLYSMSRAWHLGKAVLRAQRSKADPVESIVKHEAGKLLMKGKILDVARNRTGGFDKGTLLVDGIGAFTGQQLSVDFQNENLIAKVVKHTDAKLQGQVVATVPDLICITDVDSGEPITTEEVRFGLRVAVVALACSPLLKTEAALKVVGPKAFGYDDVEFKPIGEYKEHDPIPARA
ncbi:uncharacterized protein [Amphiura filiformis]|uniref:uncharacterized protein n=1 Tax=Amphiura filiformis TaxID=82378 RepID=UPI003B21886B